MEKERRIEDIKEMLDFMYSLLEEREISNSKVEQECYLSAGLLSRWKSGKNYPTLEYLLSIFKYLNVNIILKCGEWSPDLEPDEVEEGIVSIEMLEQRIRKKLAKKEMTPRCRLLCDILFSDDISRREKQEIYELLNLLIAAYKIEKL